MLICTNVCRLDVDFLDFKFPLNHTPDCHKEGYYIFDGTNLSIGHTPTGLDWGLCFWPNCPCTVPGIDSIKMTNTVRGKNCWQWPFQSQTSWLSLPHKELSERRKPYWGRACERCGLTHEHPAPTLTLTRAPSLRECVRYERIGCRPFWRERHSSRRELWIKASVCAGLSIRRH